MRWGVRRSSVSIAVVAAIVVSDLAFGLSGGGLQAALAANVPPAWTIVPSPAPSNHLLNAVSCVSASHCFAAGATFDGGMTDTLIEGWDGSGWSVVPSPSKNPAGGGGSMLRDLSCASPTSCVTVGCFTES